MSCMHSTHQNKIFYKLVTIYQPTNNARAGDPVRKSLYKLMYFLVDDNGQVVDKEVHGSDVKGHNFIAMFCFVTPRYGS